jgi:tRNA(Ile)-lysidine synthase
MEHITQAFLTASSIHGLLPAGASIAVAWSGGLDSTVLLDLIARNAGFRGWKVTAVTVDHGLRDFRKELETTARYAARIGVEHHILTLEPHLKNRLEGRSIQEAARDERYGKLVEFAARYKLDRIALAHHRDDQAETILLQMLRGGGWSAGAGMDNLHRSLFARPLLALSRRELADYAAACDLPVVHDPTNASDRYLRNRVRSGLLPKLEEFSPGIAQTLARSASVFRIQHEALMGFADEALNPLMVTKGKSTEVAPISALAKGSRRQVLIHRLLQRVTGVSPELTHVMAVVELCRRQDGSSEVHLPGDWVVRRLYDRLQVAAESGADANWEIELTETGVVFFPGGRIELSRQEVPTEFDSIPETTAWFDCSSLPVPLLLRNWHRGDRMEPYGAHHSVLLSDLFGGNKVPRFDRAGYPVLTDCQRNVIWLPGIRRSRLYPAVPGTTAWRLDYRSTAK